MKKHIIILIFISANVTILYAQNQVDSDFYKSKESLCLRARTGTWDVRMILQTAIDSKTTEINQLEAKRTVVGTFCLQEVMQPTQKASMPLFMRISDLDYNLNEAKWDYISIDTRITAGIMTFNNTLNQGDSIISYINNFPHPGFGSKMIDRGKNTRVRNVITLIDEDHEIIRQYWKLTDGPEWLAIMYLYSRRKI